MTFLTLFAFIIITSLSAIYVDSMRFRESIFILNGFLIINRMKTFLLVSSGIYVLLKIYLILF